MCRSVEKSVCQWACAVKPVLFKGRLHNSPSGAGFPQSKCLHLNSDSTHIGFVTLSKLLSFQVPHLYIKLSITTVPSHSSGKYSVNEGWLKSTASQAEGCPTTHITLANTHHPPAFLIHGYLHSPHPWANICKGWAEALDIRTYCGLFLKDSKASDSH